MKTIFVTSYHSFISRNILSTDVLTFLKNSGIRIVILVPSKKVGYFVDNFSDKNVEIVGFEPRTNFLHNLVYFLSVCLVSVENLFIQDLRDKKRYLRFYTALCIHKIFSSMFVIKRILRFFYNASMVSRQFSELFVHYDPVLVFSTDIYHVPDRELVAEAKKSGIFTIGMVRGWDNPISKGVLLAVPDKIISPNEVIREELWQYNRIGADKIFISGVPHYDTCLTPPRLSRAEFFAKMELNPDKKLIFFAPAGALLYKYDGEILKVLQKLKNEGKFNHHVQFLVRFHPGSKSNLNGFVPDRDFVFDEPGLDLVGTKKQSEITEHDARNLNTALFYSDVVITVVSTIAIDGAVFDKPTIIFSVNPREGLDDNIKKFLLNFHGHFKKFVGFGWCAVAHSEEELVRYINNYLANPGLDKDKRRNIVEKYCYKVDGNSSARVAKFILQHL